MITAALIAPGKPQVESPGRAVDIYTAPLVVARLNYARRVLLLPDAHIFFLSPKHGLLPINRHIEPDDTDIRTFDPPAKARWAHKIRRDLRDQFLHPISQVFVMSGEFHREPLVEMLKGIGWSVVVPVSNKESGQQIDWYNKEVLIHGRR